MYRLSTGLWDNHLLRGKCCNYDFFLVRMNEYVHLPSKYPYSVQIGKYGPEKTPYLRSFHAVRKPAHFCILSVYVNLLTISYSRAFCCLQLHNILYCNICKSIKVKAIKLKIWTVLIKYLRQFYLEFRGNKKNYLISILL